MSRYVVPDTMSWCSLIETIMAMVVPAKRPCGVVSSCETPTDMCGELSPHRDLAISAKLGGGFHCCVLGAPQQCLCPLAGDS